jgi:hypothetical protein
MDPLAGYRDAINKGELDRLLWPDTGQGKPVEEGDIFKLRSCHIEITRVHRVQPRARGWCWRAEFARYVPSGPPKFMGKSGETTDARFAMRAQDPVDPLTLTDLGERPDAHVNLGPPPEAESVPAAEVESLPSSIAARRRYHELHDEDIQKRLDRSLANQLREFRIRARHLGVDVSEETEQVADAIAGMRQKLGAAA